MKEEKIIVDPYCTNNLYLGIKNKNIKHKEKKEYIAETDPYSCNVTYLIKQKI